MGNTLPVCVPVTGDSATPSAFEKAEPVALITCDVRALLDTIRASIATPTMASATADSVPQKSCCGTVSAIGQLLYTIEQEVIFAVRYFEFERKRVAQSRQTHDDDATDKYEAAEPYEGCVIHR
jgi:hypothetical protein